MRGNHTPAVARPSTAGDEKASRMRRFFSKSAQPPGVACIAHRDRGNAVSVCRVYAGLRRDFHRKNPNPALTININDSWFFRRDFWNCGRFQVTTLHLVGVL